MPKINWEYFEYNKTVETKRKRIVAKLIRLMDPEDKELFMVKNHIVDIVKSFTLIISNDFITKFRMFDKVDNLDINSDRIRVNYSSGAYLLIKP